uniref:Fatty acid synthase pseudo-KR domain-containing protein n=1 Tax=Timema poppense TaxID=170557 RepID=A0A7R9HA65_TIMPO|nr:unnamed protein product [Timema poppensis]
MHYEDNNHEEADMLMICLEVEALYQYPDTQMVFFSPDTDVYIFILDKNAPKFSLNEDFYQQQLIQDLLVNFYDNGSWGSFRQLPIDELRELFPQNGLLPELR